MRLYAAIGVIGGWRPHSFSSECGSWGSCRRGDEGVLHLASFWVRAGAPPRNRGLHPLPRPTARRPIADFGSGTRHKTSVTPESSAAWARILARLRLLCDRLPCTTLFSV